MDNYYKNYLQKLADEFSRKFKLFADHPDYLAQTDDLVQIYLLLKYYSKIYPNHSFLFYINDNYQFLLQVFIFKIQVKTGIEGVIPWNVIEELFDFKIPEKAQSVLDKILMPKIYEFHKAYANIKEPEKADKIKTKKEKEDRGKSVEPIKRGGRHRVTKKNNRKIKNDRIDRKKIVCNLACKFIARTWQIYLKFDKEYLKEKLQAREKEVAKWDEDGELLLEKLEDIHGIQCNYAQKLSASKYLVFKLIGESLTEGKYVKNISQGYYLIIAPNSWKLITKNITPEQCTISGYTAYFIDTHESSFISFEQDNKKQIEVRTNLYNFYLYGNRLPDSTNRIGPLFGSEPPIIMSSKEDDWKDVKMIIVGKEKDKKWRKELVPLRKKKEQDLSGLLSNANSGWFFLRIYDHNDILIESLDFRYINKLKKISYEDYEHVPGKSGYTKSKVIFYHCKNLKIELAKGDKKRIRVHGNQENTIIEIPPLPAWDRTEWESWIGGSEKIKIDIVLERIWWSYITKGQNEQDAKWLDRPIKISEESIVATSEDKIFIWIPKDFFKKLEVFIGKEKILKYDAEGRRKIVIAINELSNYAEITNALNEINVGLRLFDQDGNKYESWFAIIVPKLKYNKVKPHRNKNISKLPDKKIDLNTIPCCQNCDHAREKYKIVWCNRYHWPQTYIEVFNRKIAFYKCGEWRGEYFDESGEAILYSLSDEEFD